MASPRNRDTRGEGDTPPRPWRIHVVRRQPLRQAVVMLRGPQKVTATFLWDLDSDGFQLGQMLRNNWLRLDESDLSEDGQWFSYHARTPHADDPVSGMDYHVVSRPPYLHAVYLDPGYPAPEVSSEYPRTPEALRRQLSANPFHTLRREGWSPVDAQSPARWQHAARTSAAPGPTQTRACPLDTSATSWSGTMDCVFPSPTGSGRTPTTASSCGALPVGCTGRQAWAGRGPSRPGNSRTSAV